MNLDQYQSYNVSREAYNQLYKIVSSRNHRWLHYGLLRIAGETRDAAYKKAGFKDQGISYSGHRLNNSNAVKMEKNFPPLKDFIQIGRHMNMLKVIEEQKDTILSPAERMIMLSNIAKGTLPTLETKKIKSIRKGKVVTNYTTVETKPNLNQRMKSIDFLNKMDKSYAQEIIIKRDSAAEIRDMTTEQLNQAIEEISKALEK